MSGTALDGYPGMDISMKDFSDQTMTMAALAPFAQGPTLIRNIGHIRFQETDRIHAILTELTRMIMPGEVKKCAVETYDDHRMAMAFTLTGLRTGKITIVNPECCRKTFENYFELMEELYDS